MTTNRLYAMFAVVMTLGLAVAALLASPLVPGAAALFGQGAGAPDARAAQQARDEFRSGERLAAGALIAAAAEQARDEFRRGERLAAAELLDPEIQRFLVYGSSVSPAALAEQARFDQRRGEWFAGQSARPAEQHVDWARDDWYATK